jgi:hypothetical protein
MAIKAINEIMDSYHDGMCSVIETLIRLKEIETLLEESLKEIKPKAIEFLEQNNKTYESYNYRFTIRPRTTYDYSHIRPITETESQIEKFTTYLDGLKDIAKRGGGIDPVTGEEIPKANVKKMDYNLIVQKIK